MIPSLGVVWVIAFVLLLTWILNRLLFSPVLQVMERREGAVRSARELAETAAMRAEAAAAEFESKVKAARNEIYREMDERRRAALTRRAELLAKTREEAEAALADATAQVRAQAREARARLAQEVEELGAAIAERLLGRKAS